MGDGDGMTGKDDRGRLVIDFGDAGGADTPGEPAAADGDPRFGEVLGGCRLDAVVGRGGMGITYRAFQLQEQRTVAVKVVRPELAANPEFRARFQEEIRSAAAVDHRHAVTVHFSGSDAGRLFVVMQYIDGIDLRARLERGPLTAEPAARIAEHIGGALAAAHASGVVHRDVKPENILIAGKGDRRDAFLTDFGIARAVSSPRLTRSGSWVGTILYAAPEQIHGDDVDGRADTYALGCVLYEMLTGRPPYGGRSDHEIGDQHLRAPIPAPSAVRPALAAFDPVIECALAKSPRDRFVSPADLGAAAVAAAGGSTPTGARRARSTGHGAISAPPAGAAPAAGWVGGTTGYQVAAADGATAYHDRPLPEPTLTRPAPPPEPRGRQVWIPVAACLVVLAVAGALLGPGLLSGGDEKRDDAASARARSAESADQTERLLRELETTTNALPTDRAPTAAERRVAADRAEKIGAAAREIAKDSGTTAESVDPSEDQRLRQSAQRLRAYNLALARLADRLESAARRPGPAQNLTLVVRDAEAGTRRLTTKVGTVNRLLGTAPLPTDDDELVADGGSFAWRSASCDEPCAPFDGGSARLTYDSAARQPVAVALVPDGDGQRVAVFMWDGAQWEEAERVDGETPTFTQITGTTYLDDADELLVFGYDDGGASTWTWDGEAWERAGGEGPGARDDAALAYDPRAEAAVLFGGTLVDGEDVDETWLWEDDGWRRSATTTAPSPRHAAAFARDAAGGIVLVGGQDGDDEPLDDAWRWDGGRWSEIASAGPPAGEYSLVPDEENGGVLLLGRGADGAWQQWSLAGDEWTRLEGDEPPGVGDAVVAVPNVDGEGVLLTTTDAGDEEAPSVGDFGG